MARTINARLKEPLNLGVEAPRLLGPLSSIEDDLALIRMKLPYKTGETSARTHLVSLHPPLEPLSDDFCFLLDNEVNPDVRLLCADGVVRAHRTILSARSKVFAAMFQVDTKEKESGDVDLRHMDLQTTRAFLKFIYSGKIQDVPMDMICSLYQLGEQYDVPSLKKVSSNFMARNVSEENYTEYLLLADSHGDETFKQAVIAYVINRPKLMGNSKWLKFSADHTKLALEVFQSHMDRIIDESC